MRASGSDVTLEGFAGAIDVEVERGSARLAPGAPIKADVIASATHGNVALEVPDGSAFPRPDGMTQRYDRMAAVLGIETTFHKLRHYSATETAQKISREIPPCMSMGQSAGVAAALALAADVSPGRVEAHAICARVRAQGGDPGDRPSANAKLMERAA